MRAAVVAVGLLLAGAAQAEESGWPGRVLDVTTVTLQALDAHSTWRALERGAVEGNPAMGWAAEHPARLVAAKVAAAAVIVYVTRKASSRSRWKGVLFGFAVNSAYLTVVARNYRVGA